MLALVVIRQIFKFWQVRKILFEAVVNFQGFRVFDFSHYTEIENSEIFPRLVKLSKTFCLRKLDFPSFRFFTFRKTVQSV